jgi:hypothetical protein
MLRFALELLLAPATVAVGSGAQRRWGPAIGGRIVGLPLTSLPLLVVVTATAGRAEAGAVASAVLAALPAQVALLWSYAAVAPRLGPVRALPVALAVFALAACPCLALADHPVAGAVAASAALVLALLRWPDAPVGRAAPPAGAAGVPWAAMAAAAGTTVVVAGTVGAVPAMALVLVVVTAREQGPVPAHRFVHGIVRGSFPVVAVLVVLAVLLPVVAPVVAFTAATLAAVAALVAPDAAVALRTWSAAPAVLR